MGGWKAAGTFLSTAFDQQWETIAVEQQLEVAMSYAISYNTGLLTSTEHLPRDFFCKHIPSWIICADVRDHSWYPLVAEWGVDALLSSPQCQPWQPWSGASTTPGLVCLDGKLATSSVQSSGFFLKEIRWCNDKFSSDRRCCKRRCSCLGLASMAFVFLSTVLFGYSFGILVRVVSMAIVTLIWVVFGFAWAFYERPSPCLWALTFSLCKPYFLPLPLSQWKWTGPVSYSGIFGVHFAVKFLRSF